MESFQTRKRERRPISKNTNLNVADFERNAFMYESSTSSSGARKVAVSDEEHFDNTVPCENSFLKNQEAFETQVLDVEIETQPIPFLEETQIMEVDIETQIVDDQDFVEHMDTQVLEISDNEAFECKSDIEGAEGTQPLDDTEVSMDVQPQDRNDNQITQHLSIPESLPTDNAAKSSGSLRRGFASIRTASLRAAGLAARQTASLNADSGSISTYFSSVSSKLLPFDDSEGISYAEKVSLECDEEKYVEERSNEENKNKVARSLARNLFMEEVVAKIGSDDDIDDRREDLSQLLSCDKDVAGLSYVDSQEPGELSQANALEFVDRFLKANVFESNQGVMRKNAAGEIENPGAIAKGAQSIAKKASLKSSLAEATIFEWDDNLEDEGGGEFFSKKKEVLLGHKSCPKPRRSRHCSQSLGNSRKEKLQRNLHDTVTCFLDSDLKLVDSERKGKVKDINMEKELCSGQQLATLPRAQPVDMLNVGADTQMAVEAMEELSAGIALLNNSSSVSNQSGERETDRSRKEAMKKGPLKQRSRKKKTFLFASGVATRSKIKDMVMNSGKKGEVMKMDIEKEICSGQQLASLPSAQPVDMLNVGIDTQMAAEAMEGLSSGIALLNNNCSVGVQGCEWETEPSRKEAMKKGPTKQGSRKKRTFLFTSGVATRSKVKEMIMNSGQQSKCYVMPKTREKSVVEGLNVGLVNPKKKQNRLSTNDDFALYRRKPLDTGSVSVGCKRAQSCLEGQLNNDLLRPSTKRRSLRGKSSVYTPVVQEAAKIIENSDDPSRNSRGRLLLGGLDITMEIVASQTRSRSGSDQSVERPQDGEGLLSSGMLSIEGSSQLSSKKQDTCSPPVKGNLGSTTINKSPENMQKSSKQADTTPVNLKTPASTVSPICTGDGYLTPSCKKRISLKKEVVSLISSENRCSSPFKGLRPRRDKNNVRVLFSQHLDDATVRQQKKILSRLGVSVASSMLEATHFVADSFVRTRNMLEAIANGKPVVTHLWLESCGQANCFIDENSYILRDAKKEKELGFSMPKSLEHAIRYPLLKGKRVLITPNVKPGKEVITSLVKAVHGQAIERFGRSISSKEKLVDDLLVLSCEEDFGVCVPLLEKGIAIYSSELLLNGIITQRLEYERYHLFVAHVKKTRSTLWLKKGEEQFIPVTKTNLTALY